MIVEIVLVVALVIPVHAHFSRDVADSTVPVVDEGHKVDFRDVIVARRQTIPYEGLGATMPSGPT